MKTAAASALVLSLFALAACSGGASPSQTVLPQAQTWSRAKTGGLTELFNLDYSDGAITVFSIENGKAKVTKTFKPGQGNPQGLASDAAGHIYTTLTESGSQPCAACVQVFTDTGTLLSQLDAPALKSAQNPPSLTDVSVDAHNNVYVSDYGQQAVYFFKHGKTTKHGPTIVVQNSTNAASVLATPNGTNVIVSGGCGFASVRPFTRVSRGKYSEGSCFGIGTIALIGGAVDNKEEVLTPVDGAFGLVSVSSPSGGTTFSVPDPKGSIGGIALNGDGSIAYVADAHKEYVYAFAEPSGGWISGKPKLLATYKGFKNLDIIAVPQ